MQYLKQMAADWHRGRAYGIMSACTASPLCIEAAIRAAAARSVPALVEATANQVNQNGGYTGMRPADYYALVMDIAGKIPGAQVILGGDHLGPLPFKTESAAQAMEKAEALVREYAAAGFGKLHLDTSMRLGDDDPRSPLPDRVIACRAARLARAARSGFEERRRRDAGAQPPVFIIGSEVPIPGGAQDAAAAPEAGLQVTTPEALDHTLTAFKSAFREAGEDWDQVVGVVVQPGVEFGDSELFLYDREKARALMGALKKYPPIIFEGHSTDYQTPECLRDMVRDGVCILKVGPALTFYQREALFALSAIARELGEPGDFPEVLEEAMLENPRDWEKYYPGTEAQKRFKRKYSYSDRCRYYLQTPPVAAAMEALFQSLSGRAIPLPLLSQYMPVQAALARRGRIAVDPRSLVLSRITDVIGEYAFAAAPGE